MKTKKPIAFFLAIFLVVALLPCRGAVYAADSNADAIFTEGMKYFTGDGVEQDVNKGSEMILNAANAGSADAMISLAYFCAYGTGNLFMKDYEKGMDPVYALEWLNRVADAGQTEAAAYAMIEMGYDYLIGRNERIPEDTVAAVMFFEAAERLGVYDANNTLGIFYTYGAVVDRNPDRALELFLEGALNGFQECEYSIEEYGYAYYAGNEEAIDINFGTAFQYYKALISFDNVRAMYNVGLLYIYGLGVSADRDEGVRWITKAADLGYDLAKEKLAELQAASGS